MSQTTANSVSAVDTSIATFGCKTTKVLVKYLVDLVITIEISPVLYWQPHPTRSVSFHIKFVLENTSVEISVSTHQLSE